MNSPNANKWKQAYNTEILTPIANKIWELVELPLKAQVVNSDQVFKLKLNPDNTIKYYQSRIVAKEYSQQPGYDYTKVFTLTFFPTSLHLIIALADLKCNLLTFHQHVICQVHPF